MHYLQCTSYVRASGGQSPSSQLPEPLVTSAPPFSGGYAAPPLVSGSPSSPIARSLAGISRVFCGSHAVDVSDASLVQIAAEVAFGALQPGVLEDLLRGGQFYRLKQKDVLVELRMTCDNGPNPLVQVTFILVPTLL